MPAPTNLCSYTGAASKARRLLRGLRRRRRVLSCRRHRLLLRKRRDVPILGHRSLQGSVDL